MLFLCHAKPKDEAQAALWKKLVENTLESPDTWEVALSAGKDKRENFERLLREGKLGGLAVLRNLRPMPASGVDPRLLAVNVAPYKHGISYGNGWTHIDGWSERMIDYIAAVAAEAAAQPALASGRKEGRDGLPPLRLFHCGTQSVRRARTSS